MEQITGDMIIGKVVRENPDLIQTFMDNGMMCIGCPSAQSESILDAAMVHGLDADALIGALNAAQNA